jgi:hypothetical protein
MKDLIKCYDYHFKKQLGQVKARLGLVLELFNSHFQALLLHPVHITFAYLPTMLLHRGQTNLFLIQVLMQ